MQNPLKHPLQDLGNTRTGGGPDHFLLTPDTFVRAPLPGLRNATAIIHTAPANGAGFTAYTVEFDHGGGMETSAAQMFLYILDGFVTVDHTTLSPNQYAYLPPASRTHIETHGNARALVIEKVHTALDGPTPEAFTGDEQAVDGQPMDAEPDIEVRHLPPTAHRLRFAVRDDLSARSFCQWWKATLWACSADAGRQGHHASATAGIRPKRGFYLDSTVLRTVVWRTGTPAKSCL